MDKFVAGPVLYFGAALGMGKRRQSVNDGVPKLTMTELVPTPNDCPLPRRRADFGTFTEAVDYAAKSAKGLNFHDMRGELERVYPYSEMRKDALAMAWRLAAAGVAKGDRVALVAETGPEFAALFCGAVYAGAWPVPLPLPTTFGGKDNYIEQLKVQLESSDPKLLLYPAEIAEMASPQPRGRAARGSTGKASPRARPSRPRCPRPTPTTSATCSTRRARPASRPASR